MTTSFLSCVSLHVLTDDELGTGIESTTTYYPVTTIETKTETETTTKTFTDVSTIYETTTLTIPEETSVTSTTSAYETITVTDTTVTIPTSTVYVTTKVSFAERSTRGSWTRRLGRPVDSCIVNLNFQGAPLPTTFVKRELTDDTRALFKGLYDANAAFVIERCDILYEPVRKR